MKKSLFILLPLFVLITYLSIPGAIGVVPANAYSILWQRLLSSAILLSIVIYYSKHEFLRSTFIFNSGAARWLSIVIITTIFLMPVVYAKNNFDERRIDIFRISWTHSLIVVYFISSGIYYLLYEITLRGIFLNYLKRSYSTPLAVSFNVLAYAYMHMPKSLIEAIVCIPFGLLLCIATVSTRSVLPAMLMHLVMGILIEGVMIYHINNPTQIIQP